MGRALPLTPAGKDQVLSLSSVYVGKAETRDEIAEWGYGRYEGLMTEEIRRDMENWTQRMSGMLGGTDVRMRRTVGGGRDRMRWLRGLILVINEIRELR